MLRAVIGSPLSIGRVSEVVPVAPLPQVWAPLVMERLLPGTRSPDLRIAADALASAARRLPPPWQRLVSADFSGFEAQLIYERFVGVTLSDVSAALRSTGRVLPLDVLRAVVEQLLGGMAALGQLSAPRPHMGLSDRSVGLAIDGRWCFSVGSLNHWLVDHAPGNESGDPVFDPASPDAVFFMSPEALSGRAETPASLVSRAALLAWQLATGGLHPFRGSRYEVLPSLSRFTRDEVRVPLQVHPHLPEPLAEVLSRGLRFAHRRFPDLDAFRHALDAAWPQPAASPTRTFSVLSGLTWGELQKQLRSLHREPLLPVRWDGVWSAMQTPEQGLAVLEDQLLERLEPPEHLPRCLEVSAPPPHEPPAEVSPAEPPRPGLIDRLISLFRR